MNELSFHSNKKHYTAKRINDFYFQLTASHLPSHSYIISDGIYLFMTQQSQKPLCHYCFKGRYFCFMNGIVLGTPQTITTLEQKNWKTLFTDDFFEFVEMSFAKAKPHHWLLFEHSFRKYQSTFDFFSYDHCTFCFPLANASWDTATQHSLLHEGDLTAEEFKAREKKSSSCSDQKKLLSFLKIAFGFEAYEHSFKGSGLEPDPLKGNFLTTIFSSYPSSEDTPPPLSISGAQASTKRLSRLKACMEYCERSTYNTLRIHSTVMNNVNNASFLSEVDAIKRSIFSSSYKHSFNDHAVWGIDVISGKKKLISLAYIYDEATYLETTPSDPDRYVASTSGFAAHTSQRKALEGSLLEIIERDAFLRWWKQPETGQSISAPFMNKRIKNLLECAKLYLDNPDLVLKIIALKSPLNVPVIMATLTSRTTTKAPALVIGASASFSLKKAIENAIEELSVGLLNLIARLQSGSEIFNTPLSTDYSTIKSAQDHFYLFHHPQLISKLPFHDFLLNQKPISSNKLSFEVSNFNDLKEEIENQNMHAFTLDVTPHWLRPYNIHVLRSGIFELYPLHFGFPLLINMDNISPYSASNSLPHCFP